MLLVWQILPIQAQWQHTTGPYGGLVRALAFSGADILAGTGGGGIFRSSDNGASWTALNNGLTDKGVTAIAAKSGIIVVGTEMAGVFVPTEGAEDGWGAANSGLSSLNINALAINDKNMIFAATNGAGVFISKDNGTSWQAAGLIGQKVLTLFADGSTLYAGYATNTNIGVSVSSDNGSSWKSISTGLPKMTMGAIYAEGKNVYVGFTGNNDQSGVYYSKDGGTTWKKINGSLPGGLRVYSLTMSGGNLIAGCSFGVCYSKDNGTSWSYAGGADASSIGEAYALAVGPLGLYAGTCNGLFLFSGEHSDSPASTGMTCGDVKTFVVKQGILYAGVNGGGVFQSPDDGATWTALNSGLRFVGINAIAVIDTLLFAANHNGVYIHHVYGWPESETVNSPPGVICLLANGDQLFAGTIGSGVYVSYHRGIGWVSSGLSNKRVYALALDGTKLFAGTDGGVFLSTNNGSSWNSAGLTNQWVTCFAAIGTNLFAGTEGSGVFLTSDDGVSWTEVRANQQIPPHVYALAAQDTLFFAGALDGVYVYYNNGSKWTGRSAGLSERQVYALTVYDADLFAGTDDGVWKRPLSEMNTAVRQATEEIQPNFSLSASYPNPFNPTTTIRFSLPRSAQVSVTIYNELGQQIAQLVDRKMAAGVYQTVWDASALAAGTYYCRMNAENFIATRKLTLVR